MIDKSLFYIYNARFMQMNALAAKMIDWAAFALTQNIYKLGLSYGNNCSGTRQNRW